MIKGIEHRSLDLIQESQEIRDFVRDSITSDSSQNAHMLGLHRQRNGQFAPGNFIGAVWLKDGKTILCVSPKFDWMDYLAMFLECAKHPQVRAHLRPCFNVWPKESLIDMPPKHDFSLLIIIAFLRELNDFLHRHLRRHFRRETANLIGKVKGKILPTDNLRHNIARSRPDRVFCAYQSISDDILENRILRAALECAARYLVQHSYTDKENSDLLHRWVSASRAHLRSVPVVHIRPRDHRAARRRGAFAVYRRPLEMAQAVLTKFSFNPKAEPRKISQTPPFALNSAELFERYVETVLLAGDAKIKVGYEKGTTRGSGEGENVNIRPDFWRHQEGDKKAQIMDAKYKDLGDGKSVSRDDVFQMVAYSQHKKLREKLRLSSGDNVILKLFYPCKKGEAKEDKSIDDFTSPLRIEYIECPAWQEKNGGNKP